MVPGKKKPETLMNRRWVGSGRKGGYTVEDPITYLVDFSRVKPRGSERWRFSMWTSFLSVLLWSVEWA